MGGLFVAHLLTPRYGPVPWWSPLLGTQLEPVRVAVAAAVLVAVTWLYAGNAGGRRNL